VATGINEADEIVGYSALGAGYFHAFLYANGTMIDLNLHIPDHPGWDLNYATAINDLGQIAGIGTFGGHVRGFRLDPVQTAPTAVDDAYATAFQVPLTVPAPGILGNDYGSGLSSMVAGLVTSVTHGTLALAPDGGFTYTPAAGYSGPDSFTYRAINVLGPGNLATVSLTVNQPTTVQAPTGLYVYSIATDRVTLRWLPPQSGPRPTDYALEGGINSGEVLATIGTGSAIPIFTFAAPTGSFYIRLRSVVGATQSGPSNEIRLHVGVPVAPSAPASMTGVVNGSAVNLAWRNTFSGGPPSNVILEAQTGAGTFFLPLGPTDTFGAAGVPAGTYALRVWATNAGGVSPPSNTIVITVPSACSGPPQVPSNFLAYAIGRTVHVLWDSPNTGPAATAYELIAGGAFVARIPVGGLRALSGTVGPGTYDLSVAAANPCGAGPATPVQTLVIP
jgi:probable HAF family extracellular repeat protein